MMGGKIKGTNCAIRKNIVKGVERDKKAEENYLNYQKWFQNLQNQCVIHTNKSITYIQDEGKASRALM